MKQTAVEWLVEQLIDEFSNYPDAIIEQAKQMEKDQIIDAYNKNPQGFNHSGEQYYNETFKSE